MYLNYQGFYRFLDSMSKGSDLQFEDRARKLIFKQATSIITLLNTKQTRDERKMPLKVLRADTAWTEELEYGGSEVGRVPFD